MKKENFLLEGKLKLFAAVKSSSARILTFRREAWNWRIKQLCFLSITALIIRKLGMMVVWAWGHPLSVPPSIKCTESNVTALPYRSSWTCDGLTLEAGKRWDSDLCFVSNPSVAKQHWRSGMYSVGNTGQNLPRYWFRCPIFCFFSFLLSNSGNSTPTLPRKRNSRKPQWAVNGCNSWKPTSTVFAQWR